MLTIILHSGLRYSDLFNTSFLVKVIFFVILIMIILRITGREMKFHLSFPKKPKKETDQEKREKYWISGNKDKQILRNIKEKNPSLKIFSANEPLNEVEEWDYHDNVTYLSFDGKIYANRILIWKGGGFTDWYIDTDGSVFVKMENYVALVPKHPSWDECVDENLEPFYIDNGDQGIDA